MVDPSGNELGQDQLRAYSFVWQLAQEYGKQNPRADEVLLRLSGVTKLPRAGKKDREIGRGPNALAVPVEVELRRAEAAKTARRA